jgi:hypothetical protein
MSRDDLKLLMKRIDIYNLGRIAFSDVEIIYISLFNGVVAEYKNLQQ